MTQQEFTKLTGFTPTAEDFALIHEMYMRCSTLDKEEFCRDYSKHSESTIIHELMDFADCKVESTNKCFDAYTKLQKERNTQDLEMAQFLLGKAAVYDDPDFEHEALRLISRNTAILIKIKNNYPLTQDDLEYIAQTLK